MDRSNSDEGLRGSGASAGTPRATAGPLYVAAVWSSPASAGAPVRDRPVMRRGWAGALSVRQLGLAPLVLGGLSLCVAMMSAMPAQPQGTRGDDSLPVLYGVKLDGARIAFDVVSSGCTEASHFSLRLDPEAPDTYRLSIIRHRQDRCRMAAHIVTLTLDVPAIPNPAGAGFRLTNRLAFPATLRRSDP